MKDIIYLDYAAATPLDPAVKRAMSHVEEIFANPSALTSLGRTAYEKLDQARREVARTLGARLGEIIFTSGGTEADNLAILGLARANKSSGKHLITIPTEHKSVLRSFGVLKSEGFAVEFVEVEKNGVIDLADLKRKITPQTTLISVAMASSEIGTVQPITEISRLVADVRKTRHKAKNATPIFLHSDASAAAGQLSLAVSRLGVDALSLNAAKIYGPKGSGALYLRSGVKLEPIMVGGGQEGGRRAGTENLAGAAGLAMAIKLAEKNRREEVKTLNELRDDLIRQLKKQFPKAILNGHKTKRLANNINISLPDADGEDLAARLDAAGIIVATGAACQAGNGQSSHVLRAIGRSEEEARGSLRITLGRSTTKAQLDKLLRELARLV